MRLEDLNYFLAVAEMSHVGRAAQKLGTTQPALTKGIQRLERELRLQLFERTPKGMALTSVGKAFFERARHVRFGLDEAIKEANDLHLGNIGLIRAGIAPAYADNFFAEACSELLHQRPAARMEITVGLNDALLSALHLGDLDFCISALPKPAPPEFQQKPLFNDSLYIVARENHPLFYGPSLRFTDLAQESWILPGRSVSARRSIEARFNQYGLPAPNVVIESNSSIISLIKVVKATNLLTVTSASSLGQSISTGIRRILLSEAMWPREIGITTRRGAYLSPLTLRFFDLLEQHGALYARQLNSDAS